VRLLADAFADNPLNVAVIGADTERRRKLNRHGLRILLPPAQQHGLVWAARCAGTPDGVLIANPPGTYPFPRPGAWSLLRAIVKQGPGVVSRWAEVFRTLDAAHPVTHHWYLATLGIAPAAQRRGLGRALLEAFVARVDADGLPAWLETDRERNVRFYEAAGFCLAQTLDVLGVPVFCLERPARVSPAPGMR
jgi:ribosomal protein S18 acetylase RimI-like enzyme